MLRKSSTRVHALRLSLTRTWQRASLGLFVLGAVTWPGASLLASPQAGHGSAQSLPSLLAQQETLVMTCMGRLEASNLDFTVIYSAEREFSEIALSRDGAALAAAQLSFSGRNNNDQGVWRGTTSGRAEIVLVHLSDQAVQPGDEISVLHNGQWGRGQCDGSYWRGNRAQPL